MQTDFSNSDQLLTLLLQKGDIGAFETIYHRYKAHLYRYAFSYLKDKMESEEVIQNTFILLWENRNKLDEYKSLKNYLFRITINQVFNILKHKVVKSQFADKFKAENSEADNNMQKEIYFRDLSRYLERIIEKLPEQQKNVFKMSRWGGMTNEQIAQTLKISKRTAENLLYRAMKFIKENLTDETLIILFIVLF